MHFFVVVVVNLPLHYCTKCFECFAIKRKSFLNFWLLSFNIDLLYSFSYFVVFCIKILVQCKIKSPFYHFNCELVFPFKAHWRIKHCKLKFEIYQVFLKFHTKFSHIFYSTKYILIAHSNIIISYLMIFISTNYLMKHF